MENISENTINITWYFTIYYNHIEALSYLQFQNEEV